jgi:hypothetical protein
MAVAQKAVEDCPNSSYAWHYWKRMDEFQATVTPHVIVCKDFNIA